jgi:hypothetical protein
MFLWPEPRLLLGDLTHVIIADGRLPLFPVEHANHVVTPSVTSSLLLDDMDGWVIWTLVTGAENGYGNIVRVVEPWWCARCTRILIQTELLPRAGVF